MPRLSIITINLNNSTGLEKTIQSVLIQSFKDFEYLIIDGGSVDDSISVIKKNEADLSYWISEPDTGIYNAMNKGIAKATGEYCLFLNSGDCLVDNMVLLSVFKTNPSTDIVFGNLIKKNAEKQWVDKGLKKSDITFYDLFLGTINHPASFISRRLFDEYGYYSEKYKVVSDWEFFVKSVGLGHASVQYIDINISVFDMTGLSNKSMEYYHTERPAVLKELVPVRILADYNKFSTNSGILSIINNSFISRLFFKLAYKFAKINLK